MDDQYTEALSHEEAQRTPNRQRVEEDREEDEPEELIDEPLSAQTLQWIYDHF